MDIEYRVVAKTVYKLVKAQQDPYGGGSVEELGEFISEKAAIEAMNALAEKELRIPIVHSNDGKSLYLRYD